MASTILTDRTEKVGITLPVTLLKQTDKVRGDVPRSTFIRRALENLPHLQMKTLLHGSGKKQDKQDLYHRLTSKDHVPRN